MLSQPSRELAVKLLGVVSFPERIFGIKENAGEGDVEETIYSFEEAVGFLDGDLKGVEEAMKRHPVGETVYSIEPKVLVKWVGETLGDKELAQAIEAVTREYYEPMGPYQRYLKNIELIRPVKELMAQRLKQCEEIIGEEPEAQKTRRKY